MYSKNVLNISALSFVAESWHFQF